MTHRVQLDLAVAGTFADFLHRSNVVFRSSHSTQPPSHTTTATTHRGSHSHHKDPHHRPTSGKGDYSLVIAQQHPQEVALDGHDIEMNSPSSPQEESHPQSATTQQPFSKTPMEPPSQEVLQRDEDHEAAVVEGTGHNGDGANSDDAAVEDTDVRISFSNTYQEVSPQEQLAVGENVERLNELSPDQRSRVGRVSFESIKEK
jgi:hypothetical protein